MARLTIALSLALLLAPQVAGAGTAVVWERPIREASARFGIPAAWISRVIAVESGGRVATPDGRPIRSRAGAIGLMQLMPATWRAMRRAHGLGPDPDDPRDNILAGTAYLRAMYDRFGYPGLFAAYNAGPERYREHLVQGMPLPSETVDYLVRVTGDDDDVVARADHSDAAAPVTLFAAPQDPAQGPGEAGVPGGGRPGLFFPLGAQGARVPLPLPAAQTPG